jgi:DNA-binding XRE family transcriptional regulator
MPIHQVLAEQVGCAKVTIQRIEQGTLRPSRQIAARLADVFGLRTPSARHLCASHAAGRP